MRLWRTGRGTSFLLLKIALSETLPHNDTTYCHPADTYEDRGKIDDVAAMYRGADLKHMPKVIDGTPDV